MPEQQDRTPSGHPILEGKLQLTPTWSITLPFRMAQRIEDGSLIFWSPGGLLTIYLGTWGLDGDRNSTLIRIKRDRSPNAFDVQEDRSGKVWRYTWRLFENADDDRVAAFYGMAIGSEGFVQFAAYFDNENTAWIARSVFASLEQA